MKYLLFVFLFSSISNAGTVVTRDVLCNDRGFLDGVACSQEVSAMRDLYILRSGEGMTMPGNTQLSVLHHYEAYENYPVQMTVYSDNEIPTQAHLFILRDYEKKPFASVLVSRLFDEDVLVTYQMIGDSEISSPSPFLDSEPLGEIYTTTFHNTTFAKISSDIMSRLHIESGLSVQISSILSDGIRHISHGVRFVPSPFIESADF